MINAWHLLWIVPAAGSLGAFVMALFAGPAILELENELETERQRNH